MIGSLCASIGYASVCQQLNKPLLDRDKRKRISVDLHYVVKLQYSAWCITWKCVSSKEHSAEGLSVLC